MISMVLYPAQVCLSTCRHRRGHSGLLGVISRLPIGASVSPTVDPALVWHRLPRQGCSTMPRCGGTRCQCHCVAALQQLGPCSLCPRAKAPMGMHNAVGIYAGSSQPVGAGRTRSTWRQRNQQAAGNCGEARGRYSCAAVHPTSWRARHQRRLLLWLHSIASSGPSLVSHQW